MSLDMDSFDFGGFIICFQMAHLVPNKSCKASLPEPRRDSTPFTRTCASRMAHRLRQTSIIFRQVEILLTHRRSKWTNSEAAAQATTAAADQAADHCKAFPKPLRVGFWLAAILTRSERGVNEVRTRTEIKFWETDPLSLLTGSLVATRFRILFRTVKLKSFQRWSRRGNQAKQQLQARAKRQKRRQRASKGDRGETKGRKLGKQGGGDKFERAQTVWDVGTVIAKDI